MSLRLLHYSDIENAYDDPDRIGRLAGLIDDRRDDDALVVGTGDNTAPSVLSLMTEGRQALDFFERVEPDLETFGNHDFDHGPAATRDVVRESPQTWVSANVRRNGDAFAADAGVEPWTVAETDGARVGVFGLTDAKTPSINPSATDLTFTDPVPAARRAVDALRERDVDHVVALSHLGAVDAELARAVDVDVVLGGHVHSERVERVDGTLLARPGANGSVLLEVALDADGASVTRHRVSEGPLDVAVADALQARKAALDLDETVATVEDPIERTEAATFGGESRVGNFVADAYRWAADADVGLQNGGGIRTGESLSGEVTVADLVGLIPFEEPVAVVEVTGDELLDLFGQGDGEAIAFGEPDWWHAHLSGAAVALDGGDIVRATVDGEPVDPDATYTVATSDYLLHTDHEFPVLEEHHRIRTLDTQYDVLAAYARENGIDPVVEGRVSNAGSSADTY